MRVPAPDDHRPAHDRVDHFGGLVDDHLALDLAVAVHEPFDAGRQLVKHQVVHFEHIFHLAGVDPPAFQHAGVDAVAVVEQVLDGVGDLLLVAPRGLDVVDGLEYVGSNI